MDELAMIADLKEMYATASTLEQEGKWDEADVVWDRMASAFGSDDMVKTAQAAPEAAAATRRLWPRLMELLGRGARGAGRGYDAAKEFLSPARRFERAVAPGIETLTGGPRASRLRSLERERNELPFLERLFRGRPASEGRAALPSLMQTHGPAVGAGAAAAGLGAAGVYGLGKRRGEEIERDRMMAGGGNGPAAGSYGNNYHPQDYEDWRGGGDYGRPGGYGGYGGGSPEARRSPSPAESPSTRAAIADMETRIQRLEGRVQQLETSLNSR